MEVKTGERTVKPENKVGKEPDKVPVKMATVTFKENRKYDLHIGRKVVVFKARETKDIPAAYLLHPDWKQASKLFLIKKEEEKEENGKTETPTGKVEPKKVEEK